MPTAEERILNYVDETYFSTCPRCGSKEFGVGLQLTYTVNLKEQTAKVWEDTVIQGERSIFCTKCGEEVPTRPGYTLEP